MCGGRCVPVRRLATAQLMLLISGFQYAVKRRLRGQVAALIGQPWQDLTRRQAGKGRAVADVQDGAALLGAQGIGGARTGRSGAHVGLQNRRQRPALQTAQRQSDLRAGHRLARTRGYGLVNAFNEVVPFWQRGQASSLSFPQ